MQYIDDEMRESQNIVSATQKYCPPSSFGGKIWCHTLCDASDKMSKFVSK